MLYALAAALYAVADNRALTAIYVQLGGGGSVDTRPAATLIGQRADTIMAQAAASVNAPRIQQLADPTNWSDPLLPTPLPLPAPGTYPYDAYDAFALQPLDREIP